MKKNSLIPVRQAVEDAFHEGMILGFSLGGLVESIPSKLAGKNKKQVAEIWQREINEIFKNFSKRLGEAQ